MPPIIEAHDLSKRFGDVHALDGLDVVAESGHVTALLGPNGAGKTTFISAVATLLRPDAGEVRVGGIDAVAEPGRVRQIIGLAGQFASAEPAMTGTENLAMVARLFGLCRGGSRAARPRRGRRSPGAPLLGGHAPSSRPRRQSGRSAAAAVARRARLRARPPGPDRPVGSDSPLGRRWHRRGAHYPVPGR